MTCEKDAESLIHLEFVILLQYHGRLYSHFHQHHPDDQRSDLQDYQRPGDCQRPGLQVIQKEIGEENSLDGTWQLVPPR